MLRKSIRWRIQILHGVLLTLLVAGMLATFFVYERSERLRMIDEQLSSLITPLLPRFTPPGGPDFDGPGGPGPWPDRDRRNRGGTEEFEKGPFYFIAWTPEGEIIGKSPSTPNVPIPPQGTVRAGRLLRTRGNFRELAMLTPEHSGVLVGVSTQPLNATLRRLAGELAGVGLALVVFGLTGGWWIAVGSHPALR
jgi:hypothetical protein